MTEAELKAWAGERTHSYASWFQIGEIKQIILAVIAEKEAAEAKYQALAAGAETERKSFARQIQAAKAKLAEARSKRRSGHRGAKRVARMGGA